MKRLMLFLVVLASMLSAAIVPADRAQTVAENYYQNYAPVMSKGNVVENTLTKEYMGQPTWYVFEFTKGFVIVSADDNVRPILGYSFTGKIDEDIYNMDNPFVKRFSIYDKQIVHEIREAGIERASKQKEWKDIENKVFPQNSAKASAGPLMETTWHQNYPFNDQCPTGTPVGCVATAMHQIMRFHIGPDQGWGSNSYTDNSGDVTGSHSVDFSAQTYDWSLMMTTNGSTSSQAEVDELAKMAYHLGVSVDMDYNTDGSGAYMPDAETAYKNNWGFADATYQYAGTITEPSAYYQTIQTNIDANRPIEWSGSSAESGGHAFVLDGYDIDTINDVYQYHFNWGWGGSYDGWYQLDALTPGTSIFTEGQSFIHTLWIDGDLVKMPPPRNLAGSVDAEGNVSLTWDAPDFTGITDPGTLIDYKIYRDAEYIGNTGGTTRSYVDNVLPEGSFVYTVRAVYTTPDGNSLPCDSYTASITPDPNYPVPLNLTATSYVNNRSYIDLAWSKPFIGNIAFSDDFEGNTAHGDNPAGWWEKGSNDTWPNITSWSDLSGTMGIDGFMIIGADSYPEWVFQGNYACGANGDGEEYLYSFMITEASFTLNNDAVIDYYTFYYDGTEQGVFLYGGAQGGNPTDGSGITPIKDYYTGDEAWAHDEVDLTAYSGTYRFGIYKLTQGGGSLLSFDNIVLGNDTYPDGDQPVAYEIYNNGVFETSVSCTGLSETYQSTGFTDGWNEYYVRAEYADGSYSIASNKKSAWMDANPVPTVLEGVYDETNNKSDLSWYAPGHYPPHWFGYQWENDSWNILTHFGGAGDVTLARTYYKASDFGMSYPVYISDLSAAFLEDVDAWSSNQFTIAIGTGTEGAETYLHTSGNLTAIEDGSWVDYALPATETINEDWFVEVAFGSPSDCTPNVLTYIHEEGVDEDQWNSVWYFTGDAESDAGWYAFSYESPYEYEDFAFLCYGWNDAPTITKSGAPAMEPQPFTKISNKKDLTTSNTTLSATGYQPKEHEGARKLRTDDSKGLDSYNIYRNGVAYDTATGTTYSDTNPAPNNDYYITAVYSSPVGESDSTNHVILGPPPAISVPASISKTVAPASTRDDSFNIDNSGLGNLNYTITYDYVGSLAPGGTFHSNDFATFPGTGYTNTNYIDGGGYAYLEGAKGGVTGVLTSPAFDTSGASGLTLEFDETKTFQTGLASINVEYYDGSGWVNVYSSTAGGTGTQSLALSSPSASTQLRFTAVCDKTVGAGGVTDSYQLDNILVTGQDVPYTWLNITSSTTGSVDPSSSNIINYTIDTAGLTDGDTYDANITVTSNDDTSPNVIPMSLLVSDSGPITPEVPSPVTTSVAADVVTVAWGQSADADIYDVYTSADPYGTFGLDGSTSNLSYDYTIGTENKMFFYVIARNSTKQAAAPATIEIANPNAR